jgi:hypothetical protein
MFVQSKMTKTGMPTAFIANTLQKLPERTREHTVKGETHTVYQESYKIKAYWTTSRNNGRMGLAYGTYTFTFNTIHEAARVKFSNLTYADILIHAETGYRNIYNLFDNLFKQEASYETSNTTDVIWDGLSMWDSGFGKNGEHFTVILPQLITAYQKLPTPPAGSDGWYKLLKKAK